MDSPIFEIKHNDSLCRVVENLIHNNKRVKNKVMKELIKYKISKPLPKNKTQQRLYYISIERLKNNLSIDMSVQLLHIRLEQFVRWFKFMYNSKLTLVSKTYDRLKLKFPYSKTHFGRVCNVLCIPNPKLPSWAVENDKVRFNEWRKKQLDLHR